MREGWQQEGACQQMPVSEAMVVFFPSRHDTAGMMAAKRLCRGCCVLDECREYIKTTPIHDGVVAGLSATQRMKLHISYDMPYGADLKVHSREAV